MQKSSRDEDDWAKIGQIHGKWQDWDQLSGRLKIEIKDARPIQRSVTKWAAGRSLLNSATWLGTGWFDFKWSPKETCHCPSLVVSLVNVIMVLIAEVERNRIWLTVNYIDYVEWWARTWPEYSSWKRWWLVVPWRSFFFLSLKGETRCICVIWSCNIRSLGTSCDATNLR